MAHVSGPTSSMPLSRHTLPVGTTCDFCDTAAVTRLQGETDSFGAEYSDVCQDHLDAIRKAESDNSGMCDWCKQDAPVRSPRRDVDEGMYGPVYYVCSPCVEKDRKALYEEEVYWEERSRSYDWDD